MRAAGLLLAALALSLAARAVLATPDLRLSLYQPPHTHELWMTVRLEPQESDRALTVVSDGSAYAALSEQTLDGLASPTLYHLEWHAVPPGPLRVVATVSNARGDVRASAQAALVMTGF